MTSHFMSEDASGDGKKTTKYHLTLNCLLDLIKYIYNNLTFRHLV